MIYHTPGSRWHRRKSIRLPKWSGPLSDTASDSGQWFPTDIESAFAASVRLPRGTALLVDTGSPGNIVGSEWVKDHAAELRQASLPAPRWTQRQRMLTCSGVGVGSQHASHDVEVPIGLGNGRLDGYRAPELPNSRTPALLGRNAMREKRCLVDLSLIHI